jgi:RNA polymerase sigma-70 factor (ECF subfamily)
MSIVLPAPAAHTGSLPGSAVGEGAGFSSPKDFEALYAAYFHHVTRWVRAFGCPAADIDDVAQETFLLARKRFDRFAGGNAAAWLYVTARHTTRAHRRKAWVRRVVYGDPDLRVSESRETNPVQALEQREARRQMQQILSRMTERRRTTFFLFEIEGYSGAEIAELEGVPLNTVYTRLHHARRDFMALLARAESGKKLP